MTQNHPERQGPNPDDYDLIPIHTLRTIQRFVCHGVEPGGFLMAVLQNDLREAVGRADDNNLPALGQIIMFLHNWVPGGCWGDPEKVDRWPDQAPKKAGPLAENVPAYWPDGELWPQRRI